MRYIQKYGNQALYAYINHSSSSFPSDPTGAGLGDATSHFTININNGPSIDGDLTRASNSVKLFSSCLVAICTMQMLLLMLELLGSWQTESTGGGTTTPGDDDPTKQSGRVDTRGPTLDDDSATFFLQVLLNSLGIYIGIIGVRSAHTLDLRLAKAYFYGLLLVGALWITVSKCPYILMQLTVLDSVCNESATAALVFRSSHICDWQNSSTFPRYMHSYILAFMSMHIFFPIHPTTETCTPFSGSTGPDNLGSKDVRVWLRRGHRSCNQWRRQARRCAQVGAVVYSMCVNFCLY